MPVNKGLEWTFNTEAQKYEKIRPDYILELYQDIFHYIPIDQSSTVVEIGIGGGQATLPFLKTGCKLIAVEYGENLAVLCQHKFKDFSNFSIHIGKFENFTYENDSCDLIYSASAFHWIPEKIGYKKVFEMLKSGGVFARFANHPYKDISRDELWQAIQQLYAFYLPNSPAPNQYGESNAKEYADIARKYGFHDICYKLYHRTRTFTSREYTLLLGTYSDHIAMEKNARKRFFLEIEKTIDNYGGQITIYDTIDLQLARKP